MRNALRFSVATHPARRGGPGLPFWKRASPEAAPRHPGASAGKRLEQVPGSLERMGVVTGRRGAPLSPLFPHTFYRGGQFRLLGARVLSQSDVWRRSAAAVFPFVNAVAALPLRRRFPIASLLPPVPSVARAPPALWSAQVWRRCNGCFGRRARQSGSPFSAPPRPADGPAPASATARASPGWLGPARPASRSSPSPPPPASPTPAREAERRVPEPRPACPGSSLAAGLRLCGREGRLALGALSGKAKARTCGLVQRADGGRETR